MLKQLWWKIRDFIEERIYGPAKCPEAVKEVLAHKKQGWHLMTGKEYCQLATGTLPPGTLISKPESMLDHLKATGQYDRMKQYDFMGEELLVAKPFQWVEGKTPLRSEPIYDGEIIKPEQPRIDSRYIRFESLCIAERLGRLTDAERIELDSMSSPPPFLAPWIGMRRAYFPE